jgi:DNA-binding NtrC family response regulator/predicted hydrocarbon binding protein
MKVEDLDLRELLQFEPRGGVLSFGGERAIVIDALALGLLRKELVGLLGLSGTRGVLTRFGYAHGRRTAESLRTAFPWDDESEWRRAGARLHMLKGLVDVEMTYDASGLDDATVPLVDSTWRESYEAEQHLIHQGQADQPVCWMMTGFASGYLSFCHGRRVYCIEDRCRAQGDAVCHVTARTQEQWASAIDAHLPFYELHHLEDHLAHLTEELKGIEQRLRARQPANASGDSALRALGVHARSPTMRRVVELARRVARFDSTVLIIGESGSGKERIARLIHAESMRSGGPFVALNCGAVPEGLLESELFGHVKGAFTGASQDRPGLFEAASGGTLFLDEIGDVSAAMQIKLLRSLQEREVRRIGENKARRIDVRVLAATNRDLVAEIQAARFRQDLYYRLRVVELRVPPLRERRDDILILARELLAEAVERTRSKITGLTPRAANQLVSYPWPGNVRELANAIERAVVLATGSRIEVEDLPEEIAQALPPAQVARKVRSLAEVEREYILAVLAAAEGNRAKAAEQLGIGQATLYRKLKTYEPFGARLRRER